jgi:hypothetical protein
MAYEEDPKELVVAVVFRVVRENIGLVCHERGRSQFVEFVLNMRQVVTDYCELVRKASTLVRKSMSLLTTSTAAGFHA